MAAKKDTPNLIFRREWWDFLRWESDTTVGKTVKLLCEDYFGYAPFDTEQFNSSNVPQAHERLAIPMIKTAASDKEGYIQKCDKLSANAKSKSIKTAIESNCIQLNTNADNCTQLRGNRIEENRIESNSFFSAHAHVHEAEQAEKEKKELLLELSIVFLKKTVLKPYTTAEKAFNYNESQGWKSTNKNGSTKDHSQNKLAYLTGWQCEGDNYSHADAEFFVEFSKKFGTLSPQFIDNFHGLFFEKGVYMLFDKKVVADCFNEYFKSNETLLKQANEYVIAKYPNMIGFVGKVYSK